MEYKSKLSFAPMVLLLIAEILQGKRGLEISAMIYMKDDISKALSLIADPRRGFNLGVEIIVNEEKKKTSLYECSNCKCSVQERDTFKKGSSVYHKVCQKKVEFKRFMEVLKYVLAKKGGIW